MSRSRVPLLGDATHRLVAAGTAALLFAAFLPTLAELVREWLERPEYSHGFLMPLVAGWMVWDRRKELAALHPSPSLLGCVALFFSLALLLLGEMKLSWFFKPYAFVGAAGAAVWSLYGSRALRVVFPALVVLLLMCPLPGRVQQGLTLPLKDSAALIATGLLDLSGVPSWLEGNVIHVPNIDSLLVEDACSGIRSLISLVSVALLVCFFWRRHWALRVAMVLSAIPIAILVNGLRIYATGMISVYIGADAARGFFHFFEGFALFAVAGALLWGWTALLAKATAREAA